MSVFVRPVAVVVIVPMSALVLYYASILVVSVALGLIMKAAGHPVEDASIFLPLIGIVSILIAITTAGWIGWWLWTRSR